MKPFVLELAANRDASTTLDQSAFDVGDMHIKRSKHANELIVDIPLTTSDQLYYRAHSDHIRISNEIQQLASKNCTLSAGGVYSLLQFGSAVPTTTIWNEIREFRPGFRSKIKIGDELVEEETITCWPKSRPEDSSLDIKDQTQIVRDLVDEILIDACPNRDPVILFSGGVDSGLFAARAAAMGWQDSTLVNLSFGPNDTESKSAEHMARVLGLAFIRVNALDFDDLAILDDVGTCYSRPFGDPSSSPTHSLVMSVVDQFPSSRPILDGTGADGAFGLASKSSFYQLADKAPQFVLEFFSALYGVSGLWKSASIIERSGRIVRRCAQLPIYLAAIARNPLANIAYRVSPQTQLDILDCIESWIDSSCPASEIGLKTPVADLAINCSRVLAQKTKSSLNFYDRVVKYPFLDERMIRLAIGRARYWPGHKEPKWVLKALLADSVPSDMVYRPKSGFVGPYRETFARPQFVSALDRVIEGESMLGAFLDYRVLIDLRNRVSQRAQLPGQTYWFLWAVVFLNSWLEGHVIDD